MNVAATPIAIGLIAITACSRLGFETPAGTGGDSSVGGLLGDSGASGDSYSAPGGDDSNGDATTAQWGFYKTITIATSMVAGGDLNDFPVLISTQADDDLSANASSDGADIMFTLADGTTRVPHEIEHYIDSTGELVAWVKLPVLSSTADTVIRIYYGHPTATNLEDAESVWDPDFVGVWHLDEDPSTSADGKCGGGTKEVCDSTANGFHGDAFGAMTSGDQSQGIVGGSLHFDKTDGDCVSIGYDPVFSAAGQRTVELWARTDDPNGQNVPIGLSDGGFRSIWYPYFRFQDLMFRVLDENSTAYQVDNVFPYAAQQWYYLAGVWDSSGGPVRFYIDDNPVYLSPAIPPGVPWNHTVDHVLDIGCYPDVGGGGFAFLNGSVDEVRISNTIRSADWIRTSYHNQRSPETYITFGPQKAN